MRRAANFNPGAVTEEVLAWQRDELLDVYEDRDVDPTHLQLWTTADLVAECCGSALTSLADGFVSGCAYPHETHPCQHDVFNDVFTRWQSGRPAAG